MELFAVPFGGFVWILIRESTRVHRMVLVGNSSRDPYRAFLISGSAPNRDRTEYVLILHVARNSCLHTKRRLCGKSACTMQSRGRLQCSRKSHCSALEFRTLHRHFFATYTAWCDRDDLQASARRLQWDRCRFDSHFAHIMNLADAHGGRISE